MFCCSDPGAVLDAGSLGTGEREPLEPQDGARGLSPPLDVAFHPRSFGWRRRAAAAAAVAVNCRLSRGD